MTPPPSPRQARGRVSHSLAAVHTLYEQVIAAIGAGDAPALDELLAADVIDHNPMPGQRPGLPGLPTGTVEDVLAEGDRVAGRVTWRGTQCGPFAIAEWWGAANLLEALVQIGSR